MLFLVNNHPMYYPNNRVHHQYGVRSNMDVRPRGLYRPSMSRLCVLAYDPNGSQTFEDCIQKQATNATNPYCGYAKTACGETGCKITSINPVYKDMSECQDKCDRYGYECPNKEGGDPRRVLGAIVKNAADLQCYDCSGDQGPDSSCVFKGGDGVTASFKTPQQCKDDPDKKCGWKYSCQ